MQTRTANVKPAIEEHTAIVEALKIRDSAVARAAMRAHFAAVQASGVFWTSMMERVRQTRRRSGASVRLWCRPTLLRICSRSDAHLKRQGYLAMGGQIVDVSIISEPRQRMTDEELAIGKDGGSLEGWAAKPVRMAQKDRDAGRTPMLRYRADAPLRPSGLVGPVTLMDSDLR